MIVRALFIAFLFSNLAQAQPTSMQIKTDAFGTTPDGDRVTRYTLVNSHGHSVCVMNWGATLMQVHVPDRDGKLDNVNLSFDSLENYLSGHPYFGSTVGRFCNRIEHGKFSIDGVDYQITTNAGDHTLHGGDKNFTYQFWNAEPIEPTDSIEGKGKGKGKGEGKVGVKFTLRDPDGREGFPGNVDAAVTYTWNDASELTIDFVATTDKATHLNLTNHSYWNLAGAGSGTARDHVAVIQSDQTLDVDDDLIPTGKLNDVTGTVFDFRSATTFAARIDQLSATRGYDHCYVVRGTAGTLRPAARVVDPASGRTLEIETTQPGMQLYTGNHLAGDDSSAGAKSHDAFCLETQHYPNAPNRASFPTTLVRPGETLHETTLHRFGVE